MALQDEITFFNQQQPFLQKTYHNCILLIKDQQVLGSWVKTQKTEWIPLKQKPPSEGAYISALKRAQELKLTDFLIRHVDYKHIPLTIPSIFTLSAYLTML